MHRKLEMAQDKFINSVAKLCDSFGLNKFVAQLYTVLYLSDKHMCLDELAARLGVSKGNVSINIRELEKWGAVRKIWVKGCRRDYYEAELDIKKVILSKVKSGARRRIDEVSAITDEFKEIIQSTGSEFSEEDKRVASICSQRIKKIEELKSLARTALSLGEKLI
jgi:DNA-binding transcriptional regulator GbsR (MarR family)